MKAALLLLTLAGGALLPAQDVPLQRPEERRETRRQSAEIYEAVAGISRKVSDSTVWVWVKGRQVAVGTVVGDGTQVLTKWSEIGLNYDSIQIVGGDRREATATVLGVYQEEDVALLQLEGARFTPVTWSEGETPPVGRFLVAAGPGEQALKVGVVAVKERRLGEAVLGVYLDRTYEGDGVLVAGVVEGSGAENAGIGKDDLIVALGGEEVSNVYSLQAILSKFEEGESQAIRILRNEKELELEIELSSPAMFPQIPQVRLNAMRSMGGPLSVVGKGFPRVIQTDMQLKPNQCGGPVLDLKGNVIGLSISRTDRTRTYILPAADVAAILGREATSPELAEIPRRRGGLLASRKDRPRPKAVPMNPGSADRLRKHLEEMQALLERMDEEMEEVGE